MNDKSVFDTWLRAYSRAEYTDIDVDNSGMGKFPRPLALVLSAESTVAIQTIQATHHCKFIRIRVDHACLQEFDMTIDRNTLHSMGDKCQVIATSDKRASDSPDYGKYPYTASVLISIVYASDPNVASFYISIDSEKKLATEAVEEIAKRIKSDLIISDPLGCFEESGSAE